MMGLFGRSVAHPTDTFIRNVALLSLLILGGILVCNRIIGSNNQTKPSGKPKLRCWTPAYFTIGHEEYTNHHCRHTDKKYRPYPMGPMDPNDTAQDRWVDLPLGNEPNITEDLQSRTAITDLEKKLAAQAVVAIVAFLLLRNVACRACTQARILVAGVGGSGLQQSAARELKQSYCTTVTYILVEVCYFTAMAIFTGQLHHFQWDESAADMKPGKTAVFLCDFPVRQMGNQHRHTVQCIGTTAGGTGLSTGLPQLVLYLDTVLCGALALMIFLHLIQTLLISPASAHVMAAYDISKAPSLVGRILFGCTDLNLAAIFMDVIGHPHVWSGRSPEDGIRSGEQMPFHKDTMEVV